MLRLIDSLVVWSLHVVITLLSKASVIIFVALANKSTTQLGNKHCVVILIKRVMFRKRYYVGTFIPASMS